MVIKARKMETMKKLSRLMNIRKCFEFGLERYLDEGAKMEYSCLCSRSLSGLICNTRSARLVRPKV